MGGDRHDAGSVRRSSASSSQDLSGLSDEGSRSDSNGDRRDDGEPRSIRAQVAVWLAVICGIIVAYFLLFPMVMFWLFRITDSSPPLPLSVQSFLETLCAPIEWLYEKLPWYEVYVNWLMELLMT